MVKRKETTVGGKPLALGPIVAWRDRFAYFGNGFECGDCKASFDMYMVTDKVWKNAKLKTKDNVCLSCLSKRLDRPLVLEDFNDAPVNGPITFLKEQNA